MRGNNTPPTASRRIRNDHRDTATDEFDHHLLADGVHDDIVEDAQLARLEHARALTEAAHDRRTDETALDYCAGLDTATGKLLTQIDARVMEVCAERCRRVLVDGDDWVRREWHDADEVDATKREASTWLLEHPDVGERLWGDEWHHDITLDTEVNIDA